MVDLRDQPPSSERAATEEAMWDLFYIVVALGAFALFALMVEGCDRI
jgi:hypothetical protein